VFDYEIQSRKHDRIWTVPSRFWVLQLGEHHQGWVEIYFPLAKNAVSSKYVSQRMEAWNTEGTALGPCCMEPFEESSGRSSGMLSCVTISVRGAEGKDALNIADEGRTVP